MKSAAGIKDGTSKLPLTGIERPRPTLPKQVISRSTGARAVGAFLPKLTQKAFEKFGFSAATIITDWTGIVGPGLASYTRPERLKWPRRTDEGQDTTSERDGRRAGATLILRVEGPRALEVQHRGRQLIERINAYFGYQAVTELRILQAPVMAMPTAAERLAAQARAARPADGAQVRCAKLLADQTIADGGLRNALAELAKAVMTEKHAG